MVLLSPNSIAAELAQLEDHVRGITGTLSGDFANGRVGERHNKYRHRSRVLRQLTARRDSLFPTRLRSGATV